MERNVKCQARNFGNMGLDNEYDEKRVA